MPKVPRPICKTRWQERDWYEKWEKPREADILCKSVPKKWAKQDNSTKKAHKHRDRRAPRGAVARCYSGNLLKPETRWKVPRAPFQGREFQIKAPVNSIAKSHSLVRHIQATGYSIWNHTGPTICHCTCAFTQFRGSAMLFVCSPF